MIYYIISDICGYNLYSHIAPFYDFNNFNNFNSSSSSSSIPVIPYGTQGVNKTSPSGPISGHPLNFSPAIILIDFMELHKSAYFYLSMFQRPVMNLKMTGHRPKLVVLLNKRNIFVFAHIDIFIFYSKNDTTRRHTLKILHVFFNTFTSLMRLYRFLLKH